MRQIIRKRLNGQSQRGSDLPSSVAPVRDFVTPHSANPKPGSLLDLSHNPPTLSGTMALTLAPEVHEAVIDSSARTPPAPPKGSYSPKNALDDLPGTHYALELFLASKMVESEEYCDQCDPKKCVSAQLSCRSGGSRHEAGSAYTLRPGTGSYRP